MKYLVALFLILCGAGIMYAGQVDDSPGLGGIGLLLIIGVVGWLIRSRRRAAPPTGGR